MFPLPALSPAHTCPQAELDRLSKSGLGEDEMLLRALEPGAHELPFFGGAHVLPIYPGGAAK